MLPPHFQLITTNKGAKVMSSKRMLLVVNPCSGKAKMKSYLMGVIQIFTDADYDVTVYTTKARNDATFKIQQINKNEFDIIVVCGGDGTLNEIITGMMNINLKCTLGYIPCGTLNEWSSGLKISRNILTAAKDIVDGQIINIDIGKFGDKYFSYTASFGAFTDASYSAPQSLKNALGQAAYFFQGIKSLAAIKATHLKFSFDNEEVEGDFLFGAVSNSMSVGGIVKFKESVVKLNDGLFEVLLIRKPDNILKLQPLIDGILKKDLSKEGFEFFHTSKVTVTGADIPWTLDGEYSQGTKETVIENLPNTLQLIVPKTK